MEIYFEGTKKDLEKFIKVLVNTRKNQQIEIDNLYINDSPFLFRTILVDHKGRIH